jgi:peroxiredoxin
MKKLGNIFGVSVDPSESHQAFIAKYQLPFPLLYDSDHEMVNAYGVWVDKNMYGKKYKGTERSTYVIDKTGRIAAIFRKVKPEQHVDLVKHALLQKGYSLAGNRAEKGRQFRVIKRSKLLVPFARAWIALLIVL